MFCIRLTVYYVCSAESLIVYCSVVPFNNVRVICGLKCRKQEGLAFSFPLCVRRCWTRSALEGAFSGLIKCVTVFSQQWWPVARAKLAGAYAVCFIFFSLWSLFCIPVWKCCVGILFIRVWSDVCHCLLLCERQQCSVDAFTASHHVSQSPDSPRIKNQIHFAFACGYPRCIFSRRGQQLASWLLLCNSRKLEKWLVKLPKCVYGTKVFFFCFAVFLMMETSS